MRKIKKYIKKVLFVLGLIVFGVGLAVLMPLAAIFAPKFLVINEDDESLSIVIRKVRNG